MEKIFKAKRLDNGEWHEFLLEEINPTMLENINADTICQYTGIDDKDGNRIFEGDEFYDECTGNVIARIEPDGLKIDMHRDSGVTLDIYRYSNGDNLEFKLTGHNTHDKGE